MTSWIVPSLLNVDSKKIMCEVVYQVAKVYLKSPNFLPLRFKFVHNRGCASKSFREDRSFHRVVLDLAVRSSASGMIFVSQRLFPSSTKYSQ